MSYLVDQYGDPITNLNPLPVTVSGSKVGEETTLQNAATGTGNGTAITLNGEDKVIISTSGTSTSRTLSFKATGPNSVVGNVLGSRIGADSSVTLAVSTIGISEVWEFEGLKGYTNFYVSVDAVAGGNVTVKGKVVA